MMKFPFNVKAHLRKVHFVLTVAARADKEAGLLFTVRKILSRFARQRKKYNTYLLNTSSAINTKYFNYLKKNISFNGEGKIRGESIYCSTLLWQAVIYPVQLVVLVSKTSYKEISKQLEEYMSNSENMYTSFLHFTFAAICTLPLIAYGIPVFFPAFFYKFMLFEFRSKTSAQTVDHTQIA